MPNRCLDSAEKFFLFKGWKYLIVQSSGRNLRLDVEVMAVLQTLSGVVSLAGYFNNAVDNINYVQIYRNFDKDFGHDMIQLEILAMQLSRWGSSIGLNKVKDDQSQILVSHREDDVDLAEKTVKKILERYKEAEVIFNQIFDSKRDNNLAQSQVNAPAGIVAVTQRMRMISNSRIGKVPLSAKAKWSILKRDQFLKLVHGISELTEKLVANFPGDVEAQEQLCEEDAVQIKEAAGGVADLNTVKEAAKILDRKLYEALERIDRNSVQVWNPQSINILCTNHTLIA